MERFARFTLRHNKPIISLIIILDLIALYFVFTRFAISGDILSFFRTGFKESEEFKVISEKYKGLNVILIGMKKTDITSKENLKQAYKFFNDLQKIRGISYINSFAPTRISKGMSFLSVDYNNVDKLYPDIISFMEKNNASLYKRDLGMVTVQLGSGINSNKVIGQIIKVSKRYDFEFHYSGSKIMEYYVNKYLLLIIFLIIPVVIFLVLLIFRLSLKSSKAMGLSIIPAGFAALWTFAYIFISGTSLNLLTIVTPLFVIVMGSADALHFVSHYIENRKKFIEKDKAIIESMRMVGIPMLMTTVTTMVGFLSLEVSSIPAVRQMGYFSAVGIAFAGLISWTFIPSVLKLTDLNVKEDRKAQHIDLITFFLKAYKKTKTVIISFTLVAIFFAAFIPKLRVRTDQLLFFKNYTKIVKDAHFFKKNFGYSNIAIVDYRTDLTDALYNDMVKNKIMEFERRLKNIDGVVGVISYFDIADKISKDVNNELLAKLVLYRMIKENIIPIDQWTYKNKDFKIILQLNSGNSDMLRKIRGVCENYNNVTFTGPDYLFYILNSKIVHDQISSLSLAVILVFLLLLLFYKNVEYALKGLIPILFTLVVFFGFLEISNFDLNIVIANIASIAIGVGIDYSIHFIGSYAYHKGDIDATIRSVSIPVLANALGLSVGLSGLMLSPMRVHFYISCCMWVTMLTSSFAAMLLLPILFKKP